MSEVATLNALHHAERCLALGYAPRHAIAKACEAYRASEFYVALLLVEKCLGCRDAREQRIKLDLFDQKVLGNEIHVRGTGTAPCSILSGPPHYLLLLPPGEPCRPRLRSRKP